MECPDFIVHVCSFMENPIGLKRVELRYIGNLCICPNSITFGWISRKLHGDVQNH